MKGYALRSLGIALWLGACTGDPTGPSPFQTVVRPEWLTPEVQPFLDANGQFAFPDDWQVREGDMPPAQAMAVAWARTFLGEHSPSKDRLREQRGTDITFGELVACSVPRLMRTPLSRVTDSAEAGIRNALGSQWPVALCTPQMVPMVVTFVAAQSAITTATDGSLAFPPFVPGIIGGADLPADFPISPTEPNRLGGGDPAGRTTSFFSAEEAVARTVEATGRRVAALPRDVGSIFILNPQGCGRWEIVLESPIIVLRDGTPLETDTLYVPAIHCFEEFGFSVASPERIGEDLIKTIFARDSLGMIVGTRELRVPIELPIVFHPVTIPPS